MMIKCSLQVSIPIVKVFLSRPVESVPKFSFFFGRRGVEI